MSVRVALCLELETPRLRCETFPWGPAEAELSANLYIANSSHRTLVRLPSDCDISTLLPQAHSAAGGTQHGGNDKTHVSLAIEIMGCDHGITFPLGKAMLEVPLKLKPSLDQTSSRPDPFRVCVMDDAGARAGTLSGAFVARRRAVGLSPPVVVRAPDSGTEGASSPLRRVGDAGQANASCVGVYGNEEAVKCNDETFTDKAIELLDMASKLMVTVSSSLAGRRGPQKMDAVEATGGTTPGTKDAEAPGTHQSVKAHEPAHDTEATQPDGTDTPATRPINYPTGEQSVRVATTGFRFEPTTGSVDWQRIAAVNVAKVEREGDLQTLKQFLAEVAVGRVEADEIDANPGLVNAFSMAQLQVQYVLHCEQVLQQQCNGQQAAVSSMELEIEGNSQGTIAMKERKRFLRKESRKQNKIIAGYAAMLRRHNPGLASKVRLDDKGRLKVFNVDEATRKWEKRERHRRRQKLRGKREIHGLTIFQASRAAMHKASLQHTDDSGEESPSSSQLPGSVHSWATAGSPKIARTDNIPDHQGATFGASPGAREGPNVVNNSDNSRRNQSTGGGTMDLNENEAFELRRGQFGRASIGDDIGSLGNGGGGGYGGSGHRDLQEIVIVESHTKDAQRSEMDLVDLLPPAGRRVSDLSRYVARDDERFQPDRKLGSPKFDPEAGEVKGDAREGGHRDFESGIDDGTAVWTGRLDMLRRHRDEQANGVQNDNNPPLEGTGGVRESNIAGKQQEFREEGSKYAGGLAVRKSMEYRKEMPRLVTVSVKPTRKSSFSEENNGLPGNPTPTTTIGAGVGSEDKQSVRRTHSRQVEVANVSERTRTGEATDDPPQAAGVGKWGRPGAKGDGDSISPSPTTIEVPVADASRLGLGEEDGVPDMSEFNLDDISDIEVGGEWGGGGGDGSLSS